MVLRQPSMEMMMVMIIEWVTKPSQGKERKDVGQFKGAFLAKYVLPQCTQVAVADNPH